MEMPSRSVHLYYQNLSDLSTITPSYIICIVHNCQKLFFYLFIKDKYRGKALFAGVRFALQSRFFLLFQVKEFFLLIVFSKKIIVFEQIILMYQIIIRRFFIINLVEFTIFIPISNRIDCRNFFSEFC